VQYWEFVSRAVRGDFGKSLKFNEPVMKLVAERLPATLELAFASLIVAITIAVPLGVYFGDQAQLSARSRRHERRA
jgi:peptide/nickel transport system permease protein